ncbi:MAG: S8 family serine peptidase [Rhizobiaceae bacterium]
MDPTPVDESNFDIYLEAAKRAWAEHGTGGLDAVIAELENEANDPRYDYEQVLEAVLGLVEYENTRATHYFDWYGVPNDTYTHPYTLTNVFRAWAAGLTGLGQTIAIAEAPAGSINGVIVENGFDLTHPDLAEKLEQGQTITCIEHIDYTPQNCRILADYPDVLDAEGNPGTDSEPDMIGHGTAVAGIAAGAFGGGDIVGVAPSADLVLYLGIWTDDILDAGARGAVALSNSWGIVFEDPGQADCAYEGDWKCQYLPTETHPDAYDLDDSDEFTFYLGEFAPLYDAFQNSGVVIFAKPNVDSGLRMDMYSGPDDLPHFYPELQEAWISVINARFETNENGDIFSVIRDSSPCNLSARWCLVGNGHLSTAEPGGGYDSGWGTSYVAPQVAGGVALLAEAFPSLSPADLTARLLATADNTWFLNAGDPGYSAAATLTEFKWNENEDNEFSHWYSQEWGHGIMDLEAALRPVGDLYLVTGVNLAVAGRTTVSAATLTAPSGSFAALQSSLSIPLTTFDALNGNFAINTADLVYQAETTSAAVDLLRRFERQGKGETLERSVGGFSYSATYDTSAEGLPNEFGFQHILGTSGLHLGFGFTSSEVTTSFGGLSASHAINSIGFAGLLGDTAYATLGFGGGGEGGEGGGGSDGFGDFTLFGFTGENANNVDGSISGVGARYGVHFADTQLEFSASLAAEEGSYLGISGDADVWFGGTTALTAGQFALTHDFGDGLSFTARAELGSLSGGADDGKVSLISDMEETLYSGIEIALEQQDMFVDDDALAFWISQPMRVEKSGMTLTLASGRTKEGDILYTDYQADLTPEERQIDVGVSYRFTSNEGRAQTQLGVMQSFNQGHMDGEFVTSVALRHAMKL